MILNIALNINGFKANLPQKDTKSNIDKIML